MSDLIVVEETQTIAQKIKALVLQYPYIVASIVLVICMIIVIAMYNPGNIMFKRGMTKNSKSLEGNIDRMISSIMDKQESALGAERQQRMEQQRIAAR